MMPQRRKVRITTVILGVLFLFSFLIINQSSVSRNLNVLKVDESNLPIYVSPDFIFGVVAQLGVFRSVEFPQRCL